MKEIKIIQVERNNLLLGKVSLELDGDHPFYGLLQHPLQRRLGRGGEQLLGQLLGDGASSSGTRLPHHATLHDGAPQGDEVDARMLIETFVLGGDQRMHQMGRQFGIGYRNAVGPVHIISTDDFTISRIYQRCRLADGILQIFYIG